MFGETTILKVKGLIHHPIGTTIKKMVGFRIPGRKNTTMIVGHPCLVGDTPPPKNLEFPSPVGVR